MKKIILCLLWCAGAMTARAQSASALATQLNLLVNSDLMRNGTMTFCAMDVATGQVLAQHDLHKSLIPASVMKIVTTAASIGLLGEDYRFKTSLQYDGYVDGQGVLQGNLYIKGFGDPTLASPYMEEVDKLDALLDKFVDAVKAAGIRRINGVVIGDGSHFEAAAQAPSWQWNDIGNYYGCGAAGLNIHENFYFVTLQQTPSVGSTPALKAIAPSIPYMVLVNELTTAEKGTGDRTSIFGAPDSHLRYLRGTLPVGNETFSIKGAIPDPAHYVAFRLTDALETRGVATLKLSKNIFEWEREGNTLNSRRTELLAIASPPLATIVQRANEKSNNLYCEALLKEMGRKRTSKGSTEKGVETVRLFWEDRGVPMDGFFMEDGSGLSPRNGASAFHIATILRKIARDPQLFQTFYPSLPVGGKTGTVETMFKDSKAFGDIRVKTGSMTRVRSYAGYARTASRKLVAFAVIVNNYNDDGKEIRKLLENLMSSIYELP